MIPKKIAAEKSSFIWLKSQFCRVLFAAVTLASAACVTNSHADYPRVPAAKASSPKTPQWTSEDCVEKDGVYFFVGYGEGANKSSAIGHALIASRQNALSCLFGGTIVSTVSVNQDAENITYTSKTDVILDYSHVNWSGYTIVPGRTFLVPDDHAKIYAQYRWPLIDVEKERSRLDLLSKQITETAALKKEVATKQELIVDQKSQLAELKRQELELASIKSASDKAVARLAGMRQSQKEKSHDIKKVIDSLYCGITIRQFTELFREPDKVELVATNGYNELINYVSFLWGQFQIRVDAKYIRPRIGYWPKVGEDVYNPRMVAETAPIEFVFSDYGLTNRGYQICEKWGRDD
jgi:hypothetical protein